LTIGAALASLVDDLLQPHVESDKLLESERYANGTTTAHSEWSEE